MTIQSAEEVDNALGEIDELRGNRGNGLGVCVVGYPGAGKTTFAEAMESQLESKMQADTKRFDLTNQREYLYTTNDNYIEDVAVSQSLSGETHGVVDDVQSMDEMVQLAPFFDRLCIVLVLSNALARHNRLIKREMNGEGREELVSNDTLRHLDERIGNRGLETIKKLKVRDYELENVALTQEEIEQASTYLAQKIITDYTDLR